MGVLPKRGIGTGNKILEVQILELQSPTLYIVIILNCPLIGSRSNSKANQRAAQNNCRSLASQDLYFLKFFTCKLAHLLTTCLRFVAAENEKGLLTLKVFYACL